MRRRMAEGGGQVKARGLTRDVTRRDFVGAVGAVSASAAAVWLHADQSLVAATAAQAARTPPGEKYFVLSPVNVKELDAVTATLVPTDALPGAREAKVVRFIDRAVATWAKDQRPQLLDALRALREFIVKRGTASGSFAALGEEERVETLQAFEKAHGGEFNGGFYFPTMSGMFTNPEYGGNAEKAGWKLLGFQDSFSWAPPFGYYDRG